MKSIKLRAVLFLSATFLFHGCSNMNSPLGELIFSCKDCAKVYGHNVSEEIDSKEVAVLNGGAPIWIVKVDDIEEQYKTTFDLMYQRYQIKLLPGKHQLIVATHAKAVRSPYSIQFEFEFKAGHEYFMLPDFSNGREYSIVFTEKKGESVISEQVLDNRILY